LIHLLLGAGFALELFGHRENRIGVSKTLVVFQDDLKLAVSIHGALPAVPPEVVSSAVEGIHLRKEIDPAVIISVYPVT
jgi:hypothetical protein